MSIKWNKINWNKAQKIWESCKDNSEEGFDADKFFNIMAENSGMSYKKGLLPKKFTWEDGFKCNFPRVNGKKYLCYIEGEKEPFMATYDDETQDIEPCFWDETEEIVKPDYWAEVNLPQ